MFAQRNWCVSRLKVFGFLCAIEHRGLASIRGETNDPKYDTIESLLIEIIALIKYKTDAMFSRWKL